MEFFKSLNNGSGKIRFVLGFFLILTSVSNLEYSMEPLTFIDVIIPLVGIALCYWSTLAKNYVK